MENAKIKNIIQNFLLFIFTTIVSFVICYIFLDRLFVPPYITEYGHISFRLLVSYILFVLSKWLFNKPITLFNQKIIYLLYLVFILTFLLSRRPFSMGIHNINLRIGYINDISKGIILANIIMYIPVGFFVKKLFKIKLKNLILVLIFGVYILTIEISQYFFKVGYFDVNDILLNLSGFTLGLYAYFLLEYIKLSKKANNQDILNEPKH